jgi:rhodanese-related sulfurtransferase
MLNTNQLTEIEPHTLQGWLDEGTVVLIDVREPVEYATERIPHAQLHPLSQFQPTQIQVPSGHKLVFYCQSGIRSRKAGQRCLESGFTEVAHLKGGLPAWKNQGYAMERTKNAPISIFRQVQIVAGSLVFLGTVLGAVVSPYFLILSGFVGAGLVFAGVTNTCALGMLLAKLPYNQNFGNKL